ncbi:Zinc finger protein SNAI2 [Taenia solium]|eukprot:TsM_000238600 transcript=TsM_000238600 gene=TsM_000238600
MLPLCKHISKAHTREPFLLGHKRMHTGERLFCCPTSHHAFTDQSNLRPHLWTHMEAKRYHQSHCTASFSHRCLLTQHLARCSLSFLDTANSTVITAHIIGAINPSAKGEVLSSMIPNLLINGPKIRIFLSSKELGIWNQHKSRCEKKVCGFQMTWMSQMLAITLAEFRSWRVVNTSSLVAAQIVIVPSNPADTYCGTELL